MKETTPLVYFDEYVLINNNNIYVKIPQCTRGVQYEMKTAQYIPKFYIYILCNYFNLKVCVLAYYM